VTFVTSVIGTNRTNRAGLMMSVDREDRKWLTHGRSGAFDPNSDIKFPVGNARS